MAKRYSSIVKARKKWVCVSCNMTIWPGDTFTYEADKGTGANVEILCKVCIPVQMKKTSETAAVERDSRSAGRFLFRERGYYEQDRLDANTPELTDEERAAFFNHLSQDEREQTADMFWQCDGPEQRERIYDVLRGWLSEYARSN